MNTDEAIEVLESMEWHFAKSMPKTPHEYSRKKEFSDDDKYLEIVSYIQQNGVKERFFRTYFVYLYGITHKYWVMDKNPEDAEIINRAKSELYY